MSKVNLVGHARTRSRVGEAGSGPFPEPEEIVPSLTDAISAANPLVHLKLDESAGTSATDSSGNGRTGTYAGTYTLSNETGPDGNTYVTLTDGRITIPDESVFELGASTGLTIFALVKRTSGTFLVNKGGTSSDYEWAFNANIVANVYDQAGGTRSSVSGTGPATGKWGAFCIGIPDNTVDTDIEIYSNSSLDVGGTPSHTVTSAYFASANDVWIGDRADGAAGHLVGAVAHVAIFAGLLDQLTLTSLFKSAAKEGWIEPDGLSDLRVWLDADDASTITDTAGAVSQWDDKSTNAYAFTQSTEASKPTTDLVAVGGKNSLSFDGGDSLASSTTIPLKTDRTFFMVWRPEYSGTAAVIEQSSSAGANDSALAIFQEFASGDLTSWVKAAAGTGSNKNWVFAYEVDTNNLITVVHDETHASHVLRKNGNPRVEDSEAYTGDVTAATVTDTLYIGGRGGTSLYATMRLAEVIIYDRPLDTLELLVVENYLKGKWISGVIPTDYNNLEAWYDASDESTITDSAGEITQWDDKSSNGRHLVQSSTGVYPWTGATSQNGLNTVDFRGAQFLRDTTTGFAMDFSAGEITAFLVYSEDRSNSYEGVLSVRGSGSYGIQCFQMWRRVQYPALTAGIDSATFNTSNYREDRALGDASHTGAHRVHTARIDATGNTKEYWIDGVLETLTTESGTMAASNFMSADGTNQRVMLGANSNGTSDTNVNQYLDAQIAEVVLFNRALNEVERKGLEEYLTAKWNI